MAEPGEPFIGLKTLLGAAVAVVALVFGLFNSVLSELVPPFEDSPYTVGFAHIVSLVLLLALSLVIRGRLTRLGAGTLFVFSVGLIVAAAFVFIQLQDLTRTYVYRYPPDAPGELQQRYIRGELNARGKALVGDGLVESAVKRSGGVAFVRANGILWDNTSRNAVVKRLQILYLGLIALAVTALFTASLAALVQAKQGGRSSGKRAVAP